MVEEVHLLDADIKSLFPERVYVAFKGFEVLIGPSKYGGLGPEGRQNVHDFVRRAMRRYVRSTAKSFR